MARKRKGPRLYLRHRPNCPSYWVIRDGGRMVSTGYVTHETEQAEIALAGYCLTHKQTPDACSSLREPPALHNRGMVYFVTCKAPDFPIKIGWSADAKIRLASIQVSLPFEVVLLACLPGTLEDERRLHIAFHADRLRGEWFRRSPDILKYLSEIADLDDHFRWAGRRAVRTGSVLAVGG